MTLENMTISDYSASSFFILNSIYVPNLDVKLSLTNWKIKNINLMQKHLVYMPSYIDELTITNMDFLNITMGESAPMFEFVQTNVFNSIENLTIHDIHRSTDQISEHPIIRKFVTSYLHLK